MSAAARQLFRQGLLHGRSIALTGPIPGPVGELLGELGARLSQLDPEPLADEQRASSWAKQAAPLDALICGRDAGDGLLTDTWAAVRAVATEAFIPQRAGRIVLLSPHGDAKPPAAALENLARTLSVEWARFGVTAVAVAPGAAATDAQVADLVAFLCSEAGAYFSGCRLDLR